MKFSLQGDLYEIFDDEEGHNQVRVDLVANFPAKVNTVKYYAISNFAADIGGTNALIQSVLTLLVSSFIYGEYSRYMASQIHRRNKILRSAKQNGQDSAIDVQSQDSEPSNDDDDELSQVNEGVQEIQSKFLKRVSSEGVYGLYDQIEEL